MTTPEERRRNLGWGPEMLRELAQDHGMPPKLRDEAAQLLLCYPDLERLQQADEEDLHRLQEEFADVLLATRSLFLRAQHLPSGPDQQKHRLLVILRHFS